MDAQKYGYLTVGDTVLMFVLKQLNSPSPLYAESRGHTYCILCTGQGCQKYPSTKCTRMYIYIPFSRESDYSISPMITLSAFSYKNTLRITFDLFVVGNLLYEYRNYETA
jgi:hypothetical protein